MREELDNFQVKIAGVLSFEPFVTCWSRQIALQSEVDLFDGFPPAMIFIEIPITKDVEVRRIFETIYFLHAYRESLITFASFGVQPTFTAVPKFRLADLPHLIFELI